MNFDQFIQRLPELKRATTSEDSKKILAFFEKNASPQKSFTLFYDRSPNFFSLLELSSPNFFVLTFENLEGEVQGVISFTLLKSLDFDTLYIGDFKIKAKAEETKQKWRDFADYFFENLREIEEFKNVKFIHMVMMDDNTKAYKRLVATNLLNFKFQKIHSYKMINTLAPKWWKPYLNRSYTHALYEQNYDKTFDVIQEASINKFGSNHFKLLKYRAEKITKMAKSLEVKDQQGIILLKATLEDVYPAKRIMIKRLPLSLRIFSALSPLFRTKKYSENQPLSILYLSNITFNSSLLNNSKKMADILNYALMVSHRNSKQHFHIISLSVFPEDEIWLREVRKYFLFNTESFGFYQILPSWGVQYPSNPLPSFNMSYI